MVKPKDLQPTLNYNSDSDSEQLTYTDTMGATHVINLKPTVTPENAKARSNCKNCGAGRRAFLCDYCGTITP